MDIIIHMNEKASGWTLLYSKSDMIEIEVQSIGWAITALHEIQDRLRSRDDAPKGTDHST